MEILSILGREAAEGNEKKWHGILKKVLPSKLATNAVKKTEHAKSVSYLCQKQANASLLDHSK